MVETEMGLTQPDYKKVDESNKVSFHIELEQVVWSEGTKLSKPFVEMFNPVDAQQVVDNAVSLGYTINRFCHIPKGYGKLKPQGR